MAWADLRVFGTGLALEGDPDQPTPCPLPRALVSELAELGTGAAFVAKLKRSAPEAAAFACMERLWRELYVSSAWRNHNNADLHAREAGPLGVRPAGAHGCPSFSAFLAARFDALALDLRAHWGCAINGVNRYHPVTGWVKS